MLCGFSYPQNSEFITGKSYFGKANYVEYITGNLPIIISVPHDGNLKPDFIADRKFGTTARDIGTLEIAKVMGDEIRKMTGKYPHIVISHLSRKKLDPNREEFEATQEDPMALNAWNDFHGFIETALTIAENQYGWGFYIDLHGQIHPEERIEIGYCLDNDLLALSDDELNSEAIASRSTLKNMSKLTDLSHSELIRGEKSLGAKFHLYDVDSTPSPNDPFPNSHRFFSGGYTVFRHAVMNEENISGVQLELNLELRKQSNTDATGKMLANVILDYLKTHCGNKFLKTNE